jgi:hypothetical protein
MNVVEICKLYILCPEVDTDAIYILALFHCEKKLYFSPSLLACVLRMIGQ